MGIEVLVDAQEFWPRVQRDIAAASQCVYVQTLSFETSGVGGELLGAVARSAAPDRRIVADEFYTKHKIHDRFYYHPRQFFDRDFRRLRRESLARISKLGDSGIRVKLTNPCGPLLLRSFARNHKKLVVVDERVAYLGGMNFTDHNFSWHDMMLRFDDPEISRFLAEDFRASFEGEHLSSPGCFGDVEIHRLDGRSNRKGLEPVFDLIANADRSLFVECPYVSFPFFEEFALASRRGVDVTLVMPSHDNWGLFHEYGLWESLRAGFDLRLYPRRLTHLKAMLVDDACLVAGSLNFYFPSSDFMQEFVAIIRDGDAIAQFRDKVVAVDLAHAVPPHGSVSSLRGRFGRLRLRALQALCRSLDRVLPQ